MARYDQLQDELLEITAEISEQEQLQDKTAAAITQADIAPMAKVFQARYDQIVARLTGLYARKAKAEQALSGAEVEQTIERAQQDEVAALKEAYFELERQERAEQATFDTLCKDQRARLQTFLEALRAERSAAAEPLKAVSGRKNEIHGELRHFHGVAMSGEYGASDPVKYVDFHEVIKQLFEEEFRHLQ
jgi:chromosome segregation ATPase